VYTFIKKFSPKKLYDCAIVPLSPTLSLTDNVDGRSFRRTFSHAMLDQLVMFRVIQTNQLTAPLLVIVYFLYGVPERMYPSG